MNFLELLKRLEKRAEAAYDDIRHRYDRIDNDLAIRYSWVDSAFIELNGKYVDLYYDPIENHTFWHCSSRYRTRMDGIWLAAYVRNIANDVEIGLTVDQQFQLQIAALSALSKHINDVLPDSQRQYVVQVLSYGLRAPSAILSQSLISPSQQTYREYIKEEFRVRRKMYGSGYEFVHFLTGVDSTGIWTPGGKHDGQTRVEALEEARDWARSRANVLAGRFKEKYGANATVISAPIRVLNELGNCVYAVQVDMQSKEGYRDVPCPELIIRNPRRRRKRNE